MGLQSAHFHRTSFRRGSQAKPRSLVPDFAPIRREAAGYSYLAHLPHLLQLTPTATISCRVSREPISVESPHGHCGIQDLPRRTKNAIIQQHHDLPLTVVRCTLRLTSVTISCGIARYAPGLLVPAPIQFEYGQWRNDSLPGLEPRGGICTWF